MEPIINPWWIYLLNVAGGISIVSWISTVIFGIGFIVWLCCRAVFCSGATGYDGYEDEIKITKKFWFVTPLFIFSLLIALFFPDRTTIIQMIIAKNITPINVEKAIGSGKEFKNELKKDIIDIIQSIKEKPPQEEKGR